jgi:alkanesulfonate monooxygenase SsuD/methylene tetrahydromethanopterin reductase-like flavin-dependent oxidoreductase (luciferase family)
MDIGLGLPITDPPALLNWARRADAGPFRTLGLLDRLVYDNPEPLVTLAAVAGVTTRIRVQTEVLIAPLRDPVLLASQCATLDRISGGRLTLGIGLGGRDDDYRAAGVNPRGRGQRLDAQLEVLHRIWSGRPHTDADDEVGVIGLSPHRVGGPEILFGAFAPAAIERIGRIGDGLLGAAPVPALDRLFRSVERVWSEAGRAGRPRLVAQVNVAVGPREVTEQARQALSAYYQFSPGVQHKIDGMLSSPSQIRDALDTLAGFGADEVVLYCWSHDVDQVERIADAVA